MPTKINIAVDKAATLINSAAIKNTLNVQRLIRTGNSRSTQIGY